MRTNLNINVWGNDLAAAAAVRLEGVMKRARLQGATRALHDMEYGQAQGALGSLYVIGFIHTWQLAAYENELRALSAGPVARRIALHKHDADKALAANPFKVGETVDVEWLPGEVWLGGVIRDLDIAGGTKAEVILPTGWPVYPHQSELRRPGTVVVQMKGGDACA